MLRLTRQRLKCSLAGELPQATSGKENGEEEQPRNGQVWRAEKRNGHGTEQNRGIAFVLSHRTGQAPERGSISWSSSLTWTVSGTACVLSRGTGQAPERRGHQLAIVAYGDGELYCMCTEP